MMAILPTPFQISPEQLARIVDSAQANADEIWKTGLLVSGRGLPGVSAIPNR
jgi:hypothetical protein